LNITYKKPVPTPGVFLCTATFERRERTKIFLRATVEDGAGVVYAVGEGMFVDTKAKL
jgi:thioesterase superfamily protein 4